MSRRKSLQSGQQASFLEGMLLGSPPAETVAQVPDISTEKNRPPGGLSTAEPGDADLFGFIFALSEPPSKDFWLSTPRVSGSVEQTAAVLMTLDALALSAPPGSPSGDVEIKHSAENTASSSLPLSIETASAPTAITAQPFLSVSPVWLMDRYPSEVLSITAVWNALREREGMPTVNDEEASSRVAPMLVGSLGGLRTSADVECKLKNCLQDLMTLARRLYGSEPKEDRETVQRLVTRFLQYALGEQAEEVAWLRTVVEAGVRKMLAGESQRIYSAIIISALQRPFREAVHGMLEANELPLTRLVLAKARQSGYGKVMRETLQILARHGISLQSASIGWTKAQMGGEEQKEVLWKGRCGERTAVMIAGRTVVNNHVTEDPESILIVTFKREDMEGHYPIRRADLEHARRILWSQGYHAEGEEGYPIAANVAMLWDDYFSYREYGWWYGDAEGRVTVVIKYGGAAKIKHYAKLRRAAATMQRWGYDLRYSDAALYFLPAGVDLPPESAAEDSEQDAVNEEEKDCSDRVGAERYSEEY